MACPLLEFYRGPRVRGRAFTGDPATEAVTSGPLGIPPWTHEWLQHAKVERQEATRTCLIQAGTSGS